MEFLLLPYCIDYDDSNKLLKTYDTAFYRAKTIAGWITAKIINHYNKVRRGKHAK